MTTHAELMGAPAELERCPIMPNFGPPKVMFVRGSGTELWDAEGRRYLDFLGGLAVVALGHAHPEVAEALSDAGGDAAARLLAVRHRARLARGPRHRPAHRRRPARRRAGLLLQLGRRGQRGRHQAGPEVGRPRTLRRRHHLRLVPRPHAGHARRHRPAHQARAVRADARRLPPRRPQRRRRPRGGRSTRPSPPSCWSRSRARAASTRPPRSSSGAARRLADERNLLLILDEVQTGLGRTGRWFGFQHYGIRPRRGLPGQGARQRGPHRGAVGPGRRGRRLQARRPRFDLLGPAAGDGRRPQGARGHAARRPAGARRRAGRLPAGAAREARRRELGAGRRPHPRGRARLAAPGPRWPPPAWTAAWSSTASPPPPSASRRRSPSPRRRSTRRSTSWATCWRSWPPAGSPADAPPPEVDDLTPASWTRCSTWPSRRRRRRCWPGRGMALVFEKPSARTRHSMEMAVVQLGGHPGLRAGCRGRHRRARVGRGRGPHAGLLPRGHRRPGLRPSHRRAHGGGQPGAGRQPAVRPGPSDAGARRSAHRCARSWGRPGRAHRWPGWATPTTCAARCAWGPPCRG